MVYDDDDEDDDDDDDIQHSMAVYDEIFIILSIPKVINALTFRV